MTSFNVTVTVTKQCGPTNHRFLRQRTAETGNRSDYKPIYNYNKYMRQELFEVIFLLSVAVRPQKP